MGHHYKRKSRHELFFLPQTSGHADCGFHVGSDTVNSIVNQRVIYAQAETAMNVVDDDLRDFFM